VVCHGAVDSRDAGERDHFHFDHRTRLCRRDALCAIYFGLPIAMVILSATAVPIFHRAKVYTAYQYLEQRFDAKTRALTSAIFLIQRGLAAGIGLYAPAVALSAVLGWSDRWITVLIGALVIAYTAGGGIKALTWADVQQMSMIFVALIASLFVVLHALPHNISFWTRCIWRGLPDV